MHGWGVFFFLLFLLLVIGAVGYIFFTQYRARQQGLPPPPLKSYIPFLKTSGTQSATNYPTPRSSGPIDWVKDQLDKLRNGRTARGAYEETGGTGLATGGQGPANPRSRGRGVEDDAWDDQLGVENGYAVYNEEAELGLAPTPGLQSESYGGGSGYMGAGVTSPPAYSGAAERGRSKSREPMPAPMGNESHLGDNQNPFGDQHEARSLRGVSPRPEVDMKVHVKGKSSLDQPENSSPTSRRSMFREDV